MDMNLKSTSFATRQDLAAFAKAVTDGMTAEEALSVGDNGVGEWQDSTWEPDANPPIVAMPSPTPRNTMVSVTMRGKMVECIVKDRSPAGVVDLAPSALKAFGLDPDTELLDEAIVEVL